jgi:hypothetical protein
MSKVYIPSNFECMEAARKRVEKILQLMGYEVPRKWIYDELQKLIDSGVGFQRQKRAMKFIPKKELDLVVSQITLKAKNS